MTPEEMEKRLRKLEDIEEIKQLQINYVKCLQLGNYENIEDFFTEDAFLDAAGGARGKAAIKKLFLDHISKIHTGNEGDILVNPLVTVDGDKAKGNWSMFFLYYHPVTFQSLYWVQGYYDTEFQRVNGQWKISMLKHQPRLGPPGAPPGRDTFMNFLDNAQKAMQGKQ